MHAIAGKAAHGRKLGRGGIEQFLQYGKQRVNAGALGHVSIQVMHVARFQRGPRGEHENGRPRTKLLDLSRGIFAKNSRHGGIQNDCIHLARRGQIDQFLAVAGGKNDISGGHQYGLQQAENSFLIIVKQHDFAHWLTLSSCDVIVGRRALSWVERGRGAR